jgi:membrane associated rhomboid family serine protease
MNQRPSALQQTWRLDPALSILILVNFAVFVLWYLATRYPALEQFMVDNFVVSASYVEGGRWLTLLTSAVSHIKAWHLALNMFVMWSFGIVLEQLWGSRVFAAFYLVAGVVGSACHCLASAYLLDAPGIPALGASGAVSGMLLAYAFHYPRHKILLFGIVPLPAIVGVLAFVGIDIWGLVAQSRGGGLPIGHGAHLGGALAGALIWLFYLRKRFVPRQVPRLSRAEAAEFERIIAKANESGVESLTFDEQQFVADMQHRLRPR